MPINRVQLNDIGAEFDRQSDNLIEKGYPKIAGLTEAAFSDRVLQLKAKLDVSAILKHSRSSGKISFCIVISCSLVSIKDALSLVKREGKSGFVSMYPVEPDQFQAIESITIPKEEIYLLIDFDRGSDTLNVAPQEALKTLMSLGRSPLTIEEGVAILTHYPECLVKNNCFSLLGSRCGDRRVPALWISEKCPKLGWCWDGNPHTWLGSASCSKRIG
ncbi:MAG: hypothetical protein HC838_14230 [Spirulinaceae cyanobacterium RM2_2_10]|nr:hypothetical protein [Spirulinaceae cyanobacterium RM2_2_10]